MRWFELKIFTTHKAVDAVANMFYKLDVDGVVIEDPEDSMFLDSSNDDWDYRDIEELLPEDDRSVVIGYVKQIESYESMMFFLTEEMMLIKNAGIDIGEYEIRIDELEDKDWANEWKKYYKPFAIGKNIHIVPSWEEYKSNKDDVVITIDPSGAFGTGTHETTFTCLEAIEEYIDLGDYVFDIGCGSGILSIAAAKLGASKVKGVDFSEIACKTAIKNVETNEVTDKVEIIHGNLTDYIEGKADILIANIVADIIIELCKDVRDYLNDSGYFITSGIINTKYEEVTQALGLNGFRIIKTIHKGEWYTIVSKQKNKNYI